MTRMPPPRAAACAAILLAGAAFGSAQAQTTPLDAGALDGLAPTGPGISGEPFDPVTNRLPDDGFGWLRDLDSELAELRKSGYPVPDDGHLNGYDTLTLEALAVKLKGIGDACEKAVLAKLTLDANQDNLGPHNAASLAAELLWIKLWPNDPAKADKILKWTLGHTVPGLAQWAMAEDLKSAYDTVMDYADGTWAGWKGRWGLAVYERSRTEGWSPDQISQEARTRREDLTEMQDDVDRTLAQFEAESAEREAAFQSEVQALDARLVELIERIDRDEAAQAEEKLRMAQVRDRTFEPPGLAAYPESQRRDDPDLDNRLREQYLDAVLKDPKAWYEAQRADMRSRTAQQKALMQFEHDARMALLAKGYNDALSNLLDEMIELRAEMDALETYAAPVASGKCEDLRKTGPIPLETVETLVIDRISSLATDRFEAVMTSIGVSVPTDFYACLCKSIANGGVGGGWRLDGGTCYGVGVLGGTWKVDMTGGSSSAWEACLQKVSVPAEGKPDGVPMQTLLVGKLRDLPGRLIAGEE